MVAVPTSSVCPNQYRVLLFPTQNIANQKTHIFVFSGPQLNIFVIPTPIAATNRNFLDEPIK